MPIGRAWIKPFYAQTHAPVPRLTVRVQLAIDSWDVYLQLDYKALRYSGGSRRPKVDIWTDACGETHVVAAVVHVQGE